MNALTPVTPNIHRLVIPFLDIYTTVFIITTPQGAVLLDTATYPTDIDDYVVPALHSLAISADRLRYAVITHDHRDHAGGLERFAQLYPDTVIAAGSEACAARIPGRSVRVVQDGDILDDVLRVVALPGHTTDCIGILDTRTNTLLSGDGLQLYGIYGSGNWGANIRLISRHLALTARLAQMEIDSIIASHDYHPCGYRADGKDAVGRYIAECTNALISIKAWITSHPGEDAAKLSASYNAASGLPSVGPHVFRAVAEAVETGIL